MISWKEPKKLTIKLDTEDLEDAQDIGGNPGDNHIRIEMEFNSLMTKFCEGSDINGLIQSILAHIKTQVENPLMPKGGFTLDKIMQ